MRQHYTMATVIKSIVSQNLDNDSLLLNHCPNKRLTRVMKQKQLSRNLKDNKVDEENNCLKPDKQHNIKNKIVV